MNFEELQNAWHKQDTTAHRQMSVTPDLLLQEVRRNEKNFAHLIFWRDVREVGVAFALFLAFVYWGWHDHSWTRLAIAFVCAGIGIFMSVDRWFQRQQRPPSDAPVTVFARYSLSQVNHQIGLLKNVFWWYLLPLDLSILLDIWVRGGAVLAGIVICLVITAVVYWVNQVAVRKTLQPRRHELETLLQTLDEPPIATTPPRNKLFWPVLLFCLIAAGTLTLIIGIMSQTQLPDAAGKPPTLEEVRQKYDLPALAMVVTLDGQICERGATGIRKFGDPTPVTTNDLWHIGSCTKPMTAALAGILIDHGKLRWDTTIAEVFPELVGKMDREYEAVTVEQLLKFEGGFPTAAPSEARTDSWKEAGTPLQQRFQFVKTILSHPPAVAPGKRAIYSNQDYVVVGAMLERLTGTPWEDLIKSNLFQPLHIDSAGFGAPGTTGATDQPWGHLRQTGTLVPAQQDNPPALGPAGRVHCSLDDLAKFTIAELPCGRNFGLLKPETLIRLQDAPPKNYACGWLVLKRGWANGNALKQAGSNTMWYVVIWLAPERNFSVVVATNVAGEDAAKACDDVAVAAIDKWLSQ